MHLQVTTITILRTSTNSFNINFIDVQTQIGANDCGLFAIAFAVALWSGRDPHIETYMYDQNKMRNHLHTSASVQDN